MNKALPKDLTSHDLLKATALILMVVDHIGYYFYPDQIWFRVWGRFSAPVWFFLIGYADTRLVQKEIWIGGVIVALSRIMSGQYLFPLNILFVLAFCRLLIDEVMARALKNYESFWGMFLLLFFLSFPAMIVLEYGVLGLMFAMFGYMRRHKDKLILKKPVLLAFVAGVAISYVIIQLPLLPPLSGDQLLALFVGTAILCGLLYNFTSRTYPFLTASIRPIAPLIQLLGRRTLEFYVLHLVAIAVAVMWLYPDRFVPFRFQWAPEAMLALFMPAAG